MWLCRGDGVLGEQPELAVGEEHVYSSYVPIRTPTGKMVGSYQMQVICHLQCQFQTSSAMQLGNVLQDKICNSSQQVRNDIAVLVKIFYMPERWPTIPSIDLFDIN